MIPWNCCQESAGSCVDFPSNFLHSYETKSGTERLNLRMVVMHLSAWFPWRSVCWKWVLATPPEPALVLKMSWQQEDTSHFTWLSRNNMKAFFFLFAATSLLLTQEKWLFFTKRIKLNCCNILGGLTQEKGLFFTKRIKLNCCNILGGLTQEKGLFFTKHNWCNIHSNAVGWSIWQLTYMTGACRVQVIGTEVFGS